jgi:hypothetical protein
MDEAAAEPRGQRIERLARAGEVLENARQLARDPSSVTSQPIAAKRGNIEYEIYYLDALKAEETASGYDRILLLGSDCPQCGAPSLIVRSRPSGVVSQNCLGTLLATTGRRTDHRPRSVRIDELPPVDCGSCRTRMKTGRSATGNYTYECSACARSSEVHTLVRSWDEFFPYSPLGRTCGRCGTFIAGSLACPTCGRNDTR